LGGYNKLHGEEKNLDDKSFVNKSIWTRFKVLSAGVLMNLVLAYVLLLIYFAISGAPLATDPNQYPSFVSAKQTQAVVVSVLSNSQAQKMGLDSGDIILKANGQTISDATTFSDYTASRENQAIVLQVDRNGQQLNLSGTIGEQNNKGEIGVEISNYYPKISYKWWAVPLIAGVDLFNVVVLTLSFFWNLILVLFHRAQPLGAVVGPVGVYFVTKQAIALGFSYVLRLMILLSINLAIINFIPFPALDGGRVLFLLIEKIRHKKMNENTEGLVNLIGFIILLILIIGISVHDVLKLF
jgi:regulator of sigma E protease